MDKKLETAVLFATCYMDEEENTVVMIPFRVLVGEADEKRLKFYDKLTQQVYYNCDFAIQNYIESSFYYVRDLESLQKEYNETDLIKLSNLYMEDIRKQVYYFDPESNGLLSCVTQQEFYEKTGLTVNYNFIKDDENKFNDKDEKDDREVNSEEEIPNIKEAYEKITSCVLCQDKQIKKLLTAIYKNVYFNDDNLKSNILIYGPTGVGKTAMLKQVSNLLHLPMVIEDSNRYTMNGYKGSDVEDALVNLFYAANGDIELAQHGILVFDEIDKKAANNDVSAATTEGTLNSMLKIAEGTKFNVEISHGSSIEFDTSNLTVIFSGAFSKMNQKLEPETKPIGFNSPIPKKQVGGGTTQYTAEDFVKYGFNPEFIGRINCFIGLNSLGLDDIKNILANSEMSPLKSYQAIFNQLGIDLTTQTRLIDLIAEKAYKMNTGARGLKAIVNDIFENILFDFFSEEEVIKKIELLPEVLEDNSKGYQLVKTSRKEEKTVSN